MMSGLNLITQLLKASPTASIILCPDAPFFTIASLNSSYLKLSDAAPQDLIGTSIFDLFEDPVQDHRSPPNQKLRSALISSLYAKTASIIGIQRYKPINKANIHNKLYYLNCNCYPLLDEQDQVSFIVLNVQATLRNVEQHNPVSNLLVDGKFDHPLFQDYPDAIFTLSSEGKFLSANKVLLDIADCSYEELMQHTFLSFIAAADQERVLGHFEAAIQGEIRNFDTKIISLRGNSKFINVTHLPIISDHRVVGVYLVAKDITSALEAKQQLEEQQRQLDAYYRRMSNILESIKDGFFAVDKQWKVTYWNKEAEQILQIERASIEGRMLWDLYPKFAHANFYEAYQNAMDQHTPVHMEVYYEPLCIWLDISAFPSEEGLSVYFKDVTARKFSEAKLGEAKQLYEDLFELSPLPQFVYSVKDFAFKRVNRAAITHYGYSKAEFLAMRIIDIHPEADVAQFKQLSKEKSEEKSNYKGLFRHLKKTGELIYVQASGNAIVFEGERAYLKVAVDFTDKINARKALLASEQRFKALIQDGSDMIGILDQTGRYLYVNQTCLRVLGIAPEHFIGKSAFDFIHEDDIPRVMDCFSQLADQKTIKIPIFRFLDANGQYRWVETIVTDMTDDPAVGGIVSNSRDVTERIENELKTQQSIERFNIVSKATSDAIWDYDVASGRVEWNRAIQTLFGYNKLAFTRLWWEERVHPEDIDNVMVEISAAIAQRLTRLKHEYRFRCANNSYKNVLDRSFLVYNEAGELLRIIGSMEDVTERMGYLQTLEAQNLRLKEIGWTQSHVVRAPLANVMGIAELLSIGIDDQNVQQELIMRLAKSATDLDLVIKEIVNKTKTLNEYNQG